MTWGMEDPAGRAREDLAMQTAEQFGGRPRRRRASDGLLVIIFIVLAAGAIWFTLQRADEAAANDPARDVLRGEVVGLHGLSLARPVNLRPLLASMNRAAGAHDGLLSLQISPSAAAASMITPAGDEYILEAGVGGSLTRRESGESNRTAQSALTDVDAGDVRRAILRVSRTAKLPARAFEYLTVTNPGPRQTIFVRFDAPTVRNRDWVGGGNGNTMKRINTSPSVIRSSTNTTVRVSPGDARRIARCVQNAAGDADTIQRCLP